MRAEVWLMWRSILRRKCSGRNRSRDLVHVEWWIQEHLPSPSKAGWPSVGCIVCPCSKCYCTVHCVHSPSSTSWSVMWVALAMKCDLGDVHRFPGAIWRADAWFASPLFPSLTDCSILDRVWSGHLNHEMRTTETRDTGGAVWVRNKAFLLKAIKISEVVIHSVPQLILID